MTPGEPEAASVTEALSRVQAEERELSDEALARESAQTERLAEALEGPASET